MSESEDPSPSVKSMRHRKILDIAEAQPEASMEEIATEVPSATVDLVERILDKHGDPAGNESPPTELDSNETDKPDGETDMTSIPSLDELSAAERGTLHAIYTNPEATQEEIGEVVGVSRSMISRQVNEIEGFEWDNRDAFVTRLFDGVSPPSDDSEIPSSQMEIAEQLTELDEQLATIEKHVADCVKSATADSVFTDPDLAHKIVHACIRSDRITEEEELQMLQELMQTQ